MIQNLRDITTKSGITFKAFEYSGKSYFCDRYVATDLDTLDKDGFVYKPYDTGGLGASARARSKVSLERWINSHCEEFEPE